jgi:hypothetical protein
METKEEDKEKRLKNGKDLLKSNKCDGKSSHEDNSSFSSVPSSNESSGECKEN